MLNKRLEEALNRQLNAELYSAYLYLSMSAYFKNAGLDGLARWMQVQAMEETTHALKFYDFICDRGGRVLLQPIAGPPTEWASPLAVFEATVAHEEKVSGLINDLVNLAVEEKDHATNNFLQWFVSEQVEEEASANEAAQQLRLVDQSQGGLFMLDRELGARIFTPPPGSTIFGPAA